MAKMRKMRVYAPPKPAAPEWLTARGEVGMRQSSFGRIRWAKQTRAGSIVSQIRTEMKSRNPAIHRYPWTCLCGHRWHWVSRGGISEM